MFETGSVGLAETQLFSTLFFIPFRHYSSSLQLMWRSVKGENCLPVIHHCVKIYSSSPQLVLVLSGGRKPSPQSDFTIRQWIVAGLLLLMNRSVPGIFFFF